MDGFGGFSGDFMPLSWPKFLQGQTLQKRAKTGTQLSDGLVIFHRFSARSDLAEKNAYKKPPLYQKPRDLAAKKEHRVDRP